MSLCQTMQKLLSLLTNIVFSWSNTIYNLKILHIFEFICSLSSRSKPNNFINPTGGQLVKSKKYTTQNTHNIQQPEGAPRSWIHNNKMPVDYVQYNSAI